MIKNNKLLIVGFVLSNMAALIYEVVWARELGYIFGTTAYAVSTVLASFMAGLALGSFVFGKLSDRTEPIKLFVLLELGVGMYGIFTIALFSNLHSPFLFILRTFSGTTFLLMRFILAFSLFLIPTTLIGGTFPVMSKIYTKSLKEVGGKVGVVYSLDAIGAASGAFISGFFLIPVLGLDKATIIASLMNILVGLTIYRLHLNLKTSTPGKGITSRKKGLGLFEKTVLISFFLSGFAALAYEVVWTHILTMVFGTSIYAFSLILSAFMVGLALGSFLMGKIADRLKDPVGTFVYVEFGIGLYGILLLLVFSRMDLIFLRLYFNFHQSFPVFFSSFFIVFFILLLIPAALMGSTMPLVSRIFADSLPRIGGDIGIIFSSNTFGGIFGSLIGGFLLIPILGSEKAILASAALNILAGGALVRHSKLEKERIFLLFAIFLFTFIPMRSYSIDPLIWGSYYQGIRYSDIKEYQDSKLNLTLLYHRGDPNGLVTVIRNSDGSTSLHINGKVDANDVGDIPTEYMLAYGPISFHENPVDVLNIGLGGGFTLSAIEDFEDVRTIDVVELNPRVREATEKIFSPLNDRALDDPRVNLIIADARNYMLGNEKKYDVIISEPSNPWLVGEGNLFTQEFYRLTGSKLKEGGVFAQWAPLYDLRSNDLKLLLNTFKSVFPYVNAFVIGGGDIIIVGSLEEITFDYNILKKRFDSPKVENHFRRLKSATLGDSQSPGDIEYFFSFYFMDMSELEGFIAGTEGINSDDKPVLEFSAAQAHFRKKVLNETPLFDMTHYKLRSRGAIIAIPPVKNLVLNKGETDLFELFKIEVERKDDWMLGDIGFAYIFAPESGVFNILRSFTYSTPSGELSWIRIDFAPERLSASQMQTLLSESQLVSLKFLEEFRAVGMDAYIFTDGRRLFAGWQCEEPNVNVLIFNSFDLEASKDVFERVRCT